MFEIERVADTVIKMMGLMSCNIDTAWKYCIHDLIKAEYSLNDVKAYIEKNK